MKVHLDNRENNLNAALLSQLDFFKAADPVTTLSWLQGVSAVPQES